MMYIVTNGTPDLAETELEDALTNARTRARELVDELKCGLSMAIRKYQ